MMHDIIVCGAGPAGSVVARRLAAAGARVALVGMESRPGGEGLSARGRALRPNGAPAALAQIGFRATDRQRRGNTCACLADADGRFELRCIPKGRWFLAASTPEEALTLLPCEIPAAGATAEFEIRLEKGRYIDGVLVDEAGKPLAGAEISIDMTKDNAGDADRTVEWRAAVSDAKGRFRYGPFVGDTARHLMARKTSPTGVWRGSTFSATPGDRGLEIRLIP